ncbi:AraC family transcriptional regulator [Marinomonas sp. M1K-6]|uniref:AraC family transcriptional regulator n=1 Tax=Marinomonas profundi TaxID=2726122 RepID=A0A847R8A0_9GAMM|nr:AraC family transcriptional regulator [Marinomonas profundi]NLQ17154.1 AraC family transcriptional regulator [Marinomonas profundi]UDV04653.1 AraC family transcriptional regulator [Marinomonas profundi]
MSDNNLVNLIKPLVSDDGFSDTLITHVRLMKCAKSLPRMPLIYRPGLTIIVQGRKIGYLGDREIHYNSGHYLVQTLPLPFECETFASQEEPLLGVSIEIDPVLLSELVSVASEEHLKPSVSHFPMSSVPMSADMMESVARLIKALHDPYTAKIMGQSRVRDVIFEALQSPQGDALRALVTNQGRFSLIANTLKQLHLQLDQEVRVEQLAEHAHMSVSSFHHHFKSITGSSPLQYLKRLRLLKAQMLLNQGYLNVSQVSLEVGYNSIHQFSRDYKRYFGLPPTKDLLREDTLI